MWPPPFSEVVLSASHGHRSVSTVANRIVEITPESIIDVMTDFDDYLAMKEARLSGQNDQAAHQAA